MRMLSGPSAPVNAPHSPPHKEGFHVLRGASSAPLPVGQPAVFTLRCLLTVSRTHEHFC